ncbi:SnoaL-like polyketide cyclase OS=Synechococcus sp. (strain ATCC 27167 / PCC 6312) GN=Syn6312_0859 PE=4 SV=1: SnoaL [Gemmata massiliana]|uniref:SnoaL-like domain-containing protein n=1 Tax=Gemmata massiliana TaxID=1210884 RepID=A0A6P2CR29_9BACT|nr:ester cyclase [Gemmata massiliana]VTR91339.1 SnoaL-like polyketide cyclase OS=Synechococcus sp. (strain ATCC 27167 / PCC 6312) GN=Syn6312_0859 PE=4 SV=1: SnoaL [Gemmata massiliana]
MRTVREVMVAWGEAWNGHDADALAALYHDDAVNHQVAFGAPRVGREAMREDFRAFFAAFPDSYTHVEVTLIDGARAAVEWVGGATWTGPFAGRAPTGAPFALRGCGFFVIVDGKIKAQRGYVDRATWFGQLGLPII